MNTDLITAPDVDRTMVRLDTENPITRMLEGMMATGATPEAIEKMTDLYIKMEAVVAKKQFAAAFAALQKSLPTIAAMRIIPNNDGTTRSTFAAFEDIMGKIQPHLAEHGFSVSFDTEYDVAEGGRITAICILTHTSGHSETRRFAVRTSGPPKSSAAQADGATVTYAKRYALCNMFNLSIAHDNDARAEGDFISQAQADELRARLKAVGKPEGPFLAVACTESFEKITDDKYEVLDMMLKAAERGKQQPPQAAPMTWDMLHAQMVEIAMDAKPPIANSIFDKLLAKAQEINPTKYPAIVQAAKDGKLNWATGEVKG